jgi:hypothetical protein
MLPQFAFSPNLRWNVDSLVKCCFMSVASTSAMVCALHARALISTDAQTLCELVLASGHVDPATKAP